ncbi:MAG: YjcZ family sporulation protein [Erysipelotrichaceae bacterium]|nr:YjcZ family sporulation protein [Erysipelotrichaceae bacterium]
MNNQNGCGCQSVTSAPSCTCNSGFNTSFVLILVLFILLVIIGSIYLY